MASSFWRHRGSFGRCCVALGCSSFRSPPCSKQASGVRNELLGYWRPAELPRGRNCERCRSDHVHSGLHLSLWPGSSILPDLRPLHPATIREPDTGVSISRYPAYLTCSRIISSHRLWPCRCRFSRCIRQQGGMPGCARWW